LIGVIHSWGWASAAAGTFGLAGVLAQPNSRII